MTREYDKALLVEYASWWCNEGFEEMAYRITTNADDFLASRDPALCSLCHGRVRGRRAGEGGVSMNCDKCGTEFEATGTTLEYPDCNTWTCPKCGCVRPELGSLQLADAIPAARPPEPTVKGRRK